MKNIILIIVCTFLMMDVLGLSSQAAAWVFERPVVREKVVVGGVSSYRHPLYCVNHPHMCR